MIRGNKNDIIYADIETFEEDTTFTFLWVDATIITSGTTGSLSNENSAVRFFGSIIDWGDNTADKITKYSGNTYIYVTHKYTNPGRYIIRMYNNDRCPKSIQKLTTSDVYLFSYKELNTTILLKNIHIRYLGLNDFFFENAVAAKLTNKIYIGDCSDDSAITIDYLDADLQRTPIFPHITRKLSYVSSSGELLVKNYSKFTIPDYTMRNCCLYIDETNGNVKSADSAGNYTERVTGGLFNSTEGNINQLSPKLNGGSLAGVNHQYSVISGKTVEKIYFAPVAPELKIGSTSGYYALNSKFNAFTFDFDTFELKSKTPPSSSNDVSVNILFNMKICYTDGTYDVDSFSIQVYYTPCLIAGTKITMYDGSYKCIENLTYDDLILTYDMNRNRFVGQHPCYLKQRAVTDETLFMILEDDTRIGIVKDHTFYDCYSRTFIDITTDNYTTLDIENIRLLVNDNNTLKEVKIKEFQLEKEVYRDFYTIALSGASTYFANNIMNGNNLINMMGNIDENYHHDLSVIKYLQTVEPITYDEFISTYHNIPEGLFYGHCVNYLFTAYKYGLQNTPEMISRFGEVDTRRVADGFCNFLDEHQPIPTIDGKEVYYITFYENGEYSKPIPYECGTTINLPENNTYYSLGDMKNISNTYTVIMNTVLEKI